MIGYIISPTGDLSLHINDAEAFAELMADQGRNWYSKWADAMEGACGNGLQHLAPEQIGALTDAPILTDGCIDDNGGFTDKEAGIWWYPDYMVSDPLEYLQQHGQVFFTQADRGQADRRQHDKL